MTKTITTLVFISAIIILSAACKKSDAGGTTTPPPPPTPGATATILKDASGSPVGVGISYSLMKNNSSYSNLVKAQFDRVSAGYQMKHAANVRNDGSYDFTSTDDFMSIAQTNGLTVYGHTLAWHQNNNGAYLRSLAGTTGPNLVLNSGFESGFNNWFTQVSTAAPAAGTILLETTEADPAAKLFINDYNLESDNRKLDSTIALINELKAASVPIHGVGLQMHININTSNTSIDNAFQKLAATGLLIHVTEMDVRVNPSNTTPFTTSQSLLDLQGQKYRYVAESYFRNVPAAQKYGITVWNLTDADSWIVLGGRQDFPCLFDAGYNKKIAFTEFIKGLQ